jgi:putative SOS response-associated peptidase YedK
MRWDLIPSWASDTSASQINARSETLLDKPSFRENFELRRCLIPADGFYEMEAIRENEATVPFRNEG